MRTTKIFFENLYEKFLNIPWKDTQQNDNFFV